MRAVRATPDFRRIRDLPRREPEDYNALARALTDILKTPSGTMTLRPLQALALKEIGMLGGGLPPLDVGEGKTLISLLAPVVLRARRPVLLLPANLVSKTSRERAELAEHWRIPDTIRLISYQMLGVVEHATELEDYQPDLIVCDEGHKLKNRSAAVTRRVARYMAAHPTTAFVAMSGTLMRLSIQDFAHLARWALKLNAPVPLFDGELEEWALALDERLDDELARLDPGALLEFATPEERAMLDPRIAARRGFRRRLLETPGIVASASTGAAVDIPIVIRGLRYEVTPATEAHFKKLRNRWLTPDDWTLTQAVDVWRHARELALGFHMIWDPRPPDPWRAARRAWGAFVRRTLGESRTYDSPEQVERACDAGLLSRVELDAWRAVKDTYEIHTRAIWHDDTAIRIAAAWMAQGPGIVWTEHVEFARRLSDVTGATYYGAKGLSDAGEFIDDADASRAVILSVDANREGRNLQTKWSRNLVTSPAEGADVWQQLIGRTHRPGQTAELVTVDVLFGCAEHVSAWDKALAGAVAIRDTVGAESKLLIAEIDVPKIDGVGPRWSREPE